MSIAYQVDCNICGLRMATNGQYLVNAFTLIPSGKPGAEWDVVHTSRFIQDSRYHICPGCLKGIRKITDYELEK